MAAPVTDLDGWEVFLLVVKSFIEALGQFAVGLLGVAAVLIMWMLPGILLAIAYYASGAAARRVGRGRPDA